MGRIGRLIKNTIEDFIISTVETRLNFNEEAKLYGPAGLLAVPLKEDRLLLVKIDGAGRTACAGVLNEIQDDLGSIKEGDLWLYSRDSNGTPSAYVKLNNDGSLEVNTEKGKFDIKGDKVTIEGDIEVTGGSFTCGGSVSPTGQGALCAIPSCPFTGTPHTGDKAIGT